MRGPRFRTIASQITVLTAVPVTLVLLAVAALSLYSNQRTRLDGHLRSDAEIAVLLAGSVQSVIERASGEASGESAARGPGWQSLVGRALTAPAGLDVALVDPAGLVAYHSDPERVGSAMSLRDGETDDAFSATAGSMVRTAPDLPTAIVAFAPVGDSDWLVATERPWNPWIEAFSGFGGLVVIPVFVAALLSVSLIGLSTMRITQPVRQLLARARRISAGDFRSTAPIARTGDEIEDLAVQFDSMANQLQSLYGSLEQRVTDRTSEVLSVLNLARALSQTFDPAEIVRITREQLRAHSGIGDAEVWSENRDAEPLGLPSEPPEWTARKTAHVFSLGARDTNARLGVVTRATDSDEDVLRFVEAVAAQAGVALHNAVLYRRAQATAAAEERNRLAREIHDTISQSIIGVIVQLEALRAADEDDRAKRLERTLELARSGLREARRSVQGLRASILDSQPLDRAIAADVGRLEEGGGPRARFGSSGDAGQIPSRTASELYRIAEEALANVQRHAGASNVLVNLLIDSSGVRLVIEDDGAGFDAGTQDIRGHGLAGIRERAANIGGELVLGTEPGEGTRVQVIVPQAAADGEGGRSA